MHLLKNTVLLFANKANRKTMCSAQRTIFEFRTNAVFQLFVVITDKVICEYRFITNHTQCWTAFHVITTKTFLNNKWSHIIIVVISVVNASNFENVPLNLTWSLCTCLSSSGIWKFVNLKLKYIWSNPQTGIQCLNRKLLHWGWDVSFALSLMWWRKRELTQRKMPNYLSLRWTTAGDICYVETYCINRGTHKELLSSLLFSSSTILEGNFILNSQNYFWFFRKENKRSFQLFSERCKKPYSI